MFYVFNFNAFFSKKNKKQKYGEIILHQKSPFILAFSKIIYGLDSLPTTFKPILLVNIMMSLSWSFTGKQQSINNSLS